MNNLDIFIDQFKYVNQVVRSCKTVDQLNNAKKWAEDWSKRMKFNFPDIVKSDVDLYEHVIRIV